MLTAYLAATSRLLQNPAAPVTLYSTADLTSYINTARGQTAGDGQCIRSIGILNVTPGVIVYPFSSITFAGLGIAGVLNVRQVWRQVAAGRAFVRSRSFEWFALFALNNPVPPTGPTVEWAQYGQGSTGIAGVGGSIYIDPIPDTPYVLELDCVCYPLPLATDTDLEAIPYLWTDAVPFFAAYYALMASQTGQRDQAADKMQERYKSFVDRARRASTPEVLPFTYPQSPSPFLTNQLGLTQREGSGGA